MSYISLQHLGQGHSFCDQRRPLGWYSGKNPKKVEEFTSNTQMEHGDRTFVPLMLISCITPAPEMSSSLHPLFLVLLGDKIRFKSSATLHPWYFSVFRYPPVDSS
jgi:hypothetical protein